MNAASTPRVETGPTCCHVCGKPTAETEAFARVTLHGETYLICCPMCLTAIQAGAVQRRMVSGPFSSDAATVFIEYLPAVQVGGDFGCVRPAGEERLYAVVGDVSGHGITSSIVSSRVMAEVEQMVEGGEDLASFAGALNVLMRKMFGGEYVYLTLVCSSVDFPSGEITWVNCGHPPPLLWSRRRRAFTRLEAQSIPVGLFEPEVFGRPRSDRVAFEPGDKLVLYTDVLSDLRDASGASWGEGGIRKALMPLIGEPTERRARELLERIRARHEGYAGDDVLYAFIDLHGVRP